MANLGRLKFLKLENCKIDISNPKIMKRKLAEKIKMKSDFLISLSFFTQKAILISHYDVNFGKELHRTLFYHRYKKKEF